MAGKDPSMPFYVNDWLSSAKVACMNLEQQGAYLRLLCHCWASQDASLPDDDDVLAALSGMGQGWLNGGCRLVRVCFQPHPNKIGFLTNAKLLELWQERQEWRRKSAVGGRKSAQMRELNRGKGGSTTVATKRQPKGNSSSSSLSSSNESPPTEKIPKSRSPKFDAASIRLEPPLDDPQFLEIWQEWVADRKDRNKAMTERAARIEIRNAAKWVQVHGMAAVVTCVEAAIAGKWSCLYEPKPERTNGHAPRSGELQFAGLKAWAAKGCDDDSN